MKKSYKNIFDKERRDFLKILASAGVTKQILRASPLVWGVLHSRLADAQTGPNKSMVVYVPDGCVPARWLPPNTTNLSGVTMPTMSAVYSNRSQLNFLRNVSHHRGGHGVSDTCINTVTWAEDSFDVNIGKTVGANRPFQFVNVGVMTGSQSITRNGSSMVLPEQSPYNAFRRLFSGTSSSSTSGTANPRQAIVDTHKDAIAALKSKLGTYEQQRLDAHLTAINAFQSRLGTSSSTSSSSGGACAPGTQPAQYNVNDGARFQQMAQEFAAILATALQCNLTASCCLMLGEDGGMFVMPYLNYQDNYHASIHCCGGGSEFDETRRHLGTLSNNVVSQLSSKGVLNSTIFMEVSDMGHGNEHTSSDVPIILGGGGGRIQLNRSNAGNSSHSVLNVLATAGVALNANQHAAYRFGTAVIPSVIV